MLREECLDKLKAMYDGYKFHPKGERLYNPVSVGLFFSRGGRISSTIGSIQEGTQS